MKQTAVEWLEEKFTNSNSNFINWAEEYFEQAKELEKEQSDNLAIGFANWALNQPFAIIIDKELLEIFKNK
jgi:hypothetical protein